MSKNATTTQERTDKRTLRAHWEGFEFYESGTRCVIVRNISKATPSVYTVAVAGGAPSSCTCPDWEHREPIGGCKHMRAVRANSGAVLAPSLPVGVSLEEARPADCECHEALGDLPCWPCYRDHFETPNPEVDEAEVSV